MLYNGQHDPVYQKPYVDVEEWRDAPVRHYYVHGGFEDTEVRFALYFPEKVKYEGRFFQYLAPIQGDENAAQNYGWIEDKISFSLLHGGYFVESNMGGESSGALGDPTIIVTSSAATAQYSRQVAQRLYGDHRPWGYVFGGSGGGYKTLGCIENTQGVWDGAVPFVIGTPRTIPNVFMARVHAMRLLKDKFLQVTDALDPGGSGDMYAGLDEEQADALREVTRMGFPPKTWFAWDQIGDGALSLLLYAVYQCDPGYFEDFWNVPGYLGADPHSSACRDRLQMATTVETVLSQNSDASAGQETVSEIQHTGVDEAWRDYIKRNKLAGIPCIRLQDAPPEEAYLQGVYLHFQSGALAGVKLPVDKVMGSVVVPLLSPTLDLTSALQSVKPGDQVVLDNSDYIALQTYYRHQVPTPDYKVWDQFRDEKGEPIYPQRPILAPELLAKNASGYPQNGNFHGKVIILESMLDECAYPWGADWYFHKALEAKGEQAFQDLRVWFTDNAMHGDSENTTNNNRIVSYLGELYQALLDVAAWVEQGVEPAPSTVYRYEDGQIFLPETAEERRGIQPVVFLEGNGSKAVTVKVGEPVSFTVQAAIPRNTGELTSLEWDWYGDGNYTAPSPLDLCPVNKTAGKAQGAFTYQQPGTYFVAARVTSNRHPQDRFTQVKNLDRVRVVVTA